MAGLIKLFGSIAALMSRQMRDMVMNTLEDINVVFKRYVVRILAFEVKNAVLAIFQKYFRMEMTTKENTVKDFSKLSQFFQ
jgi:hypothetical protein